MPSKKYALLAAALLSASGFGAMAADNEESLWGYADPSADVVVYINTKQPEKAMDKEVWDRIQKDKNQALKEKEEKGGGMFDTKNRDMEVIANLRIATVTPFSGSIEGVANISGNLQGDIDKLMETMNQKEGSMPQPQVSKKDDMNFYNLSLAGKDNTQGADVMVVPITPNQIQFRININPKDKMSQSLLTATPASSGNKPPPESFAKLAGQDVAFACYLVPEKLVGLNPADTDAMEALNSFMKKISDIGLTAQVSGALTILKGSFTFKSEADAAAAAESATDILPAIKSYFGTEQQSPRSTVNGKILELTIPLNTSDAWDMISRLTDENGSLDFFGIDPESDDPKPTKVGDQEITPNALPGQTE